MKLSNPVWVLPDWPGEPAQQIVQACGDWSFLPSLSGSGSFVTGEAVIALAADDPLSRSLAQRLAAACDGLGEGAFAILPQPSARRILVLGGDRRALLCGLVRFLHLSQRQQSSLEWPHGEIREKSSLPRSYYWTWDHSTNWWLQAAGQQEEGCNNIYTKTAEDFVRDYQLLTDHCLRTGVGAIVIWGFCRDDHGGVAASQRVCDYAADRGVRILPGAGTCWYGGVYYRTDYEPEGRPNPLSARHFVRENPDAGAVDNKGNRLQFQPCPAHPKTAAWLRECAQWLFRSFRIGGVNLEHGDWFGCCCDRCRAAQAQYQQPGFFSSLAAAHRPFIEEALRLQPDAWITYATYLGFVAEPYGKPWTEAFASPHDFEHWKMGCSKPEFVAQLDERAIAQWTLTSMVNTPQTPLAVWLDDARPRAMLAGEHWPAGVKPPTKRSVGFLHQGSQWCGAGATLKGMRARYSLQISCIKEACLRAAQAGLEGVAIHGEVSSRCIPYELNYLAHGYFSCYPEATLRQFGRVRLGPILRGEAAGERFVELLAKAEAATCSEAELKEIDGRIGAAFEDVWKRGQDTAPMRYWRWLRVAAQPGQWEAAQVYQLIA